MMGVSRDYNIWQWKLYSRTCHHGRLVFDKIVGLLRCGDLYAAHAHEAVTDVECVMEVWVFSLLPACHVHLLRARRELWTTLISVLYPGECTKILLLLRSKYLFIGDTMDVRILTWLNTLTNAMEFMQSFLRSVSLTPAWCAISRCSRITCCSRRLIRRPSWPTWYCCCCGARGGGGHSGAFIQRVLGSVIHAVLVGIQWAWLG